MQTNDIIILRPSRWKWLGIGLLSLAFVVAGVFLISVGKPVGWLSVIFFGFGCVVSILYLLPNASYLRITPEGFTICTMYKQDTFNWADVTEFGVGRVVNKMVMFNFEPSYQRSTRLRNVNAKLTGFEAGLPDSYGLSHEALAGLLNQYKAAWSSENRHTISTNTGL